MFAWFGDLGLMNFYHPQPLPFLLSKIDNKIY